MFRSIWIILRELTLSLAKVTLLCAMQRATPTLHGTQYTHHNLIISTKV